MGPPGDADDWLALTDDVLSVDDVSRWVVRPDCGGIVVFAGTVRDHADGRTNVTKLEYEAYAEQVVPKLAELAAEARRRWPQIGRLALLHRRGELLLEEVSVIAAVSTPHRGDAFDACRWCIDTLKQAVPIWKRETWEGGSDWGTGAAEIQAVDAGGESQR